MSYKQLSVVQKSAVGSADLTVATLQKRFGNLVRRRREAAGLSQEELAHRASLHRTYISLLERGLRLLPSIGVVQQLADALDTTMTSLVNELEES